jgi:hypothetical protein
MFGEVETFSLVRMELLGMRLVLRRSMARHARRPNGAGMTVTLQHPTQNRQIVAQNAEPFATTDPMTVPTSDPMASPQNTEPEHPWFTRVIHWLYSSENPQVRAYYEPEPETGGGKQPEPSDAVRYSPADPQMPRLSIRGNPRRGNIVT